VQRVDHLQRRFSGSPVGGGHIGRRACVEHREQPSAPWSVPDSDRPVSRTSHHLHVAAPPSLVRRGRTASGRSPILRDGCASIADPPRPPRGVSAKCSRASSQLATTRISFGPLGEPAQVDHPGAQGDAPGSMAVTRSIVRNPRAGDQLTPGRAPGAADGPPAARRTRPEPFRFVRRRARTRRGLSSVPRYPRASQHQVTSATVEPRARLRSMWWTCSRTGPSRATRWRGAKARTV